MSRKVLLADDSVTIRKIVEITFSDTDIRVDAVGSGSEALQRFENAPPDLVIADVVMPGPSGYELCERIKASSNPVPVLLLAGTFEPFDRDRATACGADGHLVKPFESRTLVEKVEALLASAGKSFRPAPPVVDSEVEAVFAEAAIAAERAASALGVDPAPEADLSPRRASPGPAGGKEGVGPGESLAVESRCAVDAPEVPAAEEVAGSEMADSGDAFVRDGGGEGAAPDVTGQALAPEVFEALVREAVRRISSEVLREVAWEVVPDLAETIIRDRLREIEREERREE